MAKTYTAYPSKIDLDSCSDEPIHLIPNVQNHGFVLVVHNEKIIQYSSNAPKILGVKNSDLLNTSISAIFGKATLKEYQEWALDKLDHIPFEVSIHDSSWLCIPHNNDDCILLDFEPNPVGWDASQFQQEMLILFRKLTKTDTLEDLIKLSASLIKELLAYDRVMLYKFDKNWNGTIVAEAKEAHLESWEGLRYPASDIPEMARKLFLQQGVRILCDITETYSYLEPTLNPITKNLTNVGKSHLRGSSPIHLEYLNNMKVGATLNCAIIIEGNLWGLISCHHYSKKYVDFKKRQAILLLSEMISNQLAQKKTRLYLDRLTQISVIRTRLLDNLNNDWDIINGLTAHKTNALKLIDAGGFAVVHDGETVTLGTTPNPSQILDILKTLEEKNRLIKDYYATDCLLEDIGWSELDSKNVSGVLICKLSHKLNDALIWFRPEVISSVTWGGNPDENKTSESKAIRLSPRKSFEKWSQKVHCTSESWNDHEIAAANQLTADIRNVIVTKFGEISQLNKKLTNLNQELESFSYSVSHDLRGPLRGIDGFAQILLEDYADVLDKDGLESLQIIINSAEKMNTLMDEILSYSGLNQVKTRPIRINVRELCEDIVDSHGFRREYPNTKWEIQNDLPILVADKSMMYQLFSNLLTNAAKYSSKALNPLVSVRYRNYQDNNIFSIKDNGIGFDMKHADKLFRIFTRLVTDEYKGTGVGLAIAQRIVLKHDGEIWAEASVGNGATFSFYIKELRN